MNTQYNQNPYNGVEASTSIILDNDTYHKIMMKILSSKTKSCRAFINSSETMLCCGKWNLDLHDMTLSNDYGVFKPKLRKVWCENGLMYISPYIKNAGSDRVRITPIHVYWIIYII